MDRLDAVVASHADGDHAGGLVDVVGAFPPSAFHELGHPHTTRTYSDLLGAVEASGVRYVETRTGETIDLDPDVSMRFVRAGSARTPTPPPSPCASTTDRSRRSSSGTWASMRTLKGRRALHVTLEVIRCTERSSPFRVRRTEKIGSSQDPWRSSGRSAR